MRAVTDDKQCEHNSNKRSCYIENFCLTFFQESTLNAFDVTTNRWLIYK